MDAHPIGIVCATDDLCCPLAGTQVGQPADIPHRLQRVIRREGRDLDLAMALARSVPQHVGVDVDGAIPRTIVSHIPVHIQASIKRHELRDVKRRLDLLKVGSSLIGLAVPPGGDAAAVQALSIHLVAQQADVLIAALACLDLVALTARREATMRAEEDAAASSPGAVLVRRALAAKQEVAFTALGWTIDAHSAQPLVVRLPASVGIAIECMSDIVLRGRALAAKGGRAPVAADRALVADSVGAVARRADTILAFAGLEQRLVAILAEPHVRHRPVAATLILVACARTDLPHATFIADELVARFAWVAWRIVTTGVAPDAAA